MRHARGQPAIVRSTRSPARANASAGSISIASTTTSTGVTFDIPHILSGRPATARTSAVTPVFAGSPLYAKADSYCAGRTTAISISACLAFASRSALEGNNSFPLLLPVIQTAARKYSSP